MKTTQNTAQQGDFLFKKLNSLPKGTKKTLQKNSIVLASSQTTGHKHQISSKNSKLVEINNKNFLDLKSTATLTHEEHLPIRLSSGFWELGKVQEFDYFLMMKRAVVD